MRVLFNHDRTPSTPPLPRPTGDSAVIGRYSLTLCDTHPLDPFAPSALHHESFIHVSRFSLLPSLNLQ